ncbi:MAG: pectinesterase family protein [Clostridia bacterium]|nr:pectinesterase family protein [Clostridia bacterium]
MKKLSKWLIALLCTVGISGMTVLGACADDNGDSSGGSESTGAVESSSTEESGSVEESTGGEEEGGGEETDGISFTQESVSVEFDTASTTATTLDLMSYLDEDTAVTEITWSSSDETIATINESGVLTVVSAGSVTITAANDDETVKATITVVITAYEWVESALDYDAISDYYTDNGMTVGTTKLTSALTVGIYTIDSGMRLDKSSSVLNLNTQGSTGVTVVLSGKTNTISAEVRGASSSGDAVFVLYSVDDEGNKTALEYSWTAANGASVEVSVTGLEAGTYYFADTASYSGRIYDLTVSQYLEVSDVTGITATAGTTDFLVGRDFTYTDLNVVTNYENGSARVNSDYTVAVYSDEDCTTAATSVTAMAAGTYYVKVSSTIDESEYSDVYTIVVHDISNITLYDYTYSKSGTVTNHLQTIYIQNSGDVFDSSYLTVVAETDDEDVTFILEEDEYDITQSLDVTAAGSYTVSVSNKIGTADTETYTVYVVGAISSSKAAYTVSVDASASVAVDTAANTATFNTVTQALQYLNLIGAGDNYIKTINIAAGTYYEKIYVDMPNVQFIGQGSTYDDVVLWFDLIAGMVEPSGASVYSTDGSASVTLSEDAAGFYATNLTIKNYYNTNTLYQKSLTISTDSQAVALLNQADQSYIYNCKITGYHDTLYAQVGRQVYEDCYIEGRTDYIFGYNATVYLTN